MREILSTTSGWVNRTKDIQNYPWVSAAHGFCPSQAVAWSHLVALPKHQPLAVRQHHNNTTYVPNVQIRLIKGAKNENKSYFAILLLLTLELIKICLC